MVDGFPITDRFHVHHCSVNGCEDTFSHSHCDTCSQTLYRDVFHINYSQCDRTDDHIHCVEVG
jgi:hypothetical protein